MADPRLEDQLEKNARSEAIARPGAWARLKGWLQAHHMTLMTLPDTPHSIALGSAIGMFFGFTPLFGMKTLLTLALAWLLKGNKIAAFISVTLHDLLLPFVTIFFWQYRNGNVGVMRAGAATSGISAFTSLSVITWSGRHFLP